MTKCVMCEGLLEDRCITRLQEYNGRWYMIENPPALVCRQCGETYYRPDAHDRVLDLIMGGAEPIRMESIAVLDARLA